MNILILCTRYPLELGNAYLTNNLADALSENGHNVQVAVLDWDAPPWSPTRRLRQPNGVDVLAIAPRSVQRAGWLIEKGSKWILSSLFATREMKKNLGDGRFNLMICFSPLTTVATQVVWLMWKFKNIRSYLVQWDFFPYHHRSIGLIGGKLAFAVALRIEQLLMRKFDVIGCMSPMNVKYLKANYDAGLKPKIEVLPIWGEVSAPPAKPLSDARARYNLPLDRKIVVFGGQITQGRGVEDILAAAAMAAPTMPDVVFLIIGDGRLAHLVEDYVASGPGNVIYRRRIPRDEYLSLVAACDVGLVATVRGVDVPTFPSKMIDYLRAGVPIAAAVEASTDFGDFVEERRLGRAVQAGDAGALLSIIAELIGDETKRSAFKAAGRQCLDEVFDVRIAASAIVAGVSNVKALSARTVLP